MANENPIRYIFGGLVLALAIALPFLYSCASSASDARFPKLRNKRICLLIAHPDDEAMFFAPTVLALTRPEANNHVKILCLSTGNADGLGETRRKELVQSAKLLGLRDEADVTVVDSPDFPDSMTINWDTERIVSCLSSLFVPNLVEQKHSSTIIQGRTTDIDVIVTFDDCGVSGHPNHISLYHGARAFVAALARANKPPSASTVDLYTLTSVNIARKYSSFLDGFVTLLLAPTGTGRGTAAPEEAKRPASGEVADSDAESDEGEDEVVVTGTAAAATAAAAGAAETLVNMVALSVSGSTARERYSTGRRAMVDAHKSQMVWFRWGWILLSRYMVVNDLKLERVVVAEPISS